VIYSQKTANPISIIAWADQKKANHNIDYELVIGMNNVIYQGLFTYDSFRMQWSLKLKAYTVPPMGSLIRNFYSIDLSRDRVFVYIGTSSGEMMVYRRDTVVFRSCIPVCTNGLQDLVVLSDDSVVCGGGDGAFVKLVGSDMTWQKAFEVLTSLLYALPVLTNSPSLSSQVKMDSLIRSISLSANNRELIVACASGSIYRCLTDSLAQTLVSVSANSALTCIAFPNTTYPPPPSIYYFATGSRNGEIRTWDLTDYACLSVLRMPKCGAVLSMAMVDSDRILSGWQDGSIRCSDSNGKQLWFIPTAHRDGTTTIAAHVDNSLQYFATGGGDGAIRVWKYTNRELITQYTEHRRGVAKILIDFKAPNIVHSVGGDCSVLSYDLKAGKRIICHIVNNGVMSNMTQRKDGEQEVITCDSYGRLLYWDVDIREPVLAVQDPSRQMIRTCQVSPSGKFLAFAGDDQILKVLDSQSFQIISLGQSHSGPILTLHWTPDERQILTGGEDMCISVWNFYLGGEAK
jgi:WD40 repeat protein